MPIDFQNGNEAVNNLKINSQYKDCILQQYWDFEFKAAPDLQKQWQFPKMEAHWHSALLFF